MFLKETYDAILCLTFSLLLGEKYFTLTCTLLTTAVTWKHGTALTVTVSDLQKPFANWFQNSHNQLVVAR